MLYNYIALVFFLLFGLFIPLSLLLAAVLLGHRTTYNSVKNAPYESGEETIGSSRDVDNEYMPYFMIFLPFEIILAILILWSLVARQVGRNLSLEIAFLGVTSLIFSLIGYKFISDKNV